MPLFLWLNVFLHLTYNFLSIRISLLSCRNWDTASHCSGSFLFLYGVLRPLLEMITARLDWKRLDGYRLGLDSSLLILVVGRYLDYMIDEAPLAL